MSAWTLWTWAAIAALGLGAPAAFLWFLRDASRLFREAGDPERNGEGREAQPRPPRPGGT